MPDIKSERRRGWVERSLAALPGLSAVHRNFLSVPLMEPRWHLLVDRGSSFPPAGRAAGFAIGPAGVLAFVFTDRALDDRELGRIRKHAEETCAGLAFGRSQYVPHMLEVMLLMPRAVADAHARFVAVDLSSMRRRLRSRETVLTGNRPWFVATAIAARAERYTLISTNDAPTTEATAAASLFAASELQVDERNKAIGRPFQDWMTFLDPNQLALVHRNFTGPARFSGPAGTGKTVVALHRMARFSKNNPGRLLFTSFVKTLPTYHRSGFQRLAPLAEGRAEFIGLHAWTTHFLADRGIRCTIDTGASEDAFGRAWAKARAALAPIVPENVYWKDELHRVIKGRGLNKLTDYQAIERTGRNHIRLDKAQREIVWKQLYEPYQQRMAANGAKDFHDAFMLAIESLAEHPLEDPYGLVVVDEVQDFTLVELRLVHQIAGGGPNAPLLLVGDGQQQVYAGGWRLSDAGIPIRGRGEILQVNYRNRAAVHQYAKNVDATNMVDDLDGAPGFVLRDTEVVLPDGRAESERIKRRDLAARIVSVITECGIHRSDIAVIANTKKEAEHLQSALIGARIPTQSLEKYDGTYQDAVKVGTVHRAKGMDFAAVLHPTSAPGTARDLTDVQRDRAELTARQTMVALTRARDYIWVGLVED
ncbi:UvrD-helicase domain-containing protein [Nocardia brasiliensis]|uniref:UvrD-helicase domain-containing protein n=1 Tax=Nocardia brasiliensis TaxID=37326 RepID=UPI00245420C7|nr:UvrD-helicase domain-containing protein [Nocardia brasiliensis]